MTADSPKPRVLCVDDEANILEGLTLHLRRRFELVTTVSAPRALEHLQVLART